MKICITSSGKSAESMLDPRFGRCSYFVIADTKTGELSFIPNEAGESGGGAGISAGQLMAKENVSAVVTGNVGPNAESVLKAAGIEIFKGEHQSIKNNLEKYKSGALQKISKSVPPHFGMGNKGAKS